MIRRTSARQGSALLEFTLSSIPLIFVVISLAWVCMGMWQYHTMAEAIDGTTRWAASHGAGCVSKTCATTVDDVAKAIVSRAIGVPYDKMNVTLTSTGSTVTCNPLSSCYGNSAYWPSLSGNVANTTDITIQGTYQFSSPISVYTPGKGKQQISAVTFGAKSRQPVVF